MIWLDKLKQLAKIKIGDITIFDFSRTVLTIDRNNTSEDFSIRTEGDRTLVNINLQELKKDDLAQVGKILTTAVKKDNQLLLEKGAEELLEDFIEKEKDPVNQELLRFFNGKIPSQDFGAFRASLYLKNKFDARDKNLSEIKRGITEQYGVRGKYICNLCTAGYFEKWIKPLYKQIDTNPDFTIKDFDQIYNIIIMQHAFSVFVHNYMSFDETKKAIEKQINKNKSYGIYVVNIHGIGKGNVRKITKAVEEIETETKVDKTVDERGGVIYIKLRFTE